jgi:hypothetical protein
MILSKRHKFVFIKGKKVAGTSVELALTQICGPDDIITPLTPIDERTRLPCGARNYSDDPQIERDYLTAIASSEVQRGTLKNFLKPRYRNHMRISDVEQKFGSLADYEILFVERNPYAKVISWANMEGGGYAAYNSGQAVQSVPAEIQRRVEDGIDTGAIRGVRNIDRYRLHGQIRPGWRYETLQSQIEAWAADKGGVVLPHAKPGMMSNDLDVGSWLTPSQVEQINRLFADEFIAFGYQPLAT